MQVTPVTLHGSRVRMEPLEERHLPQLFELASNDLFKYMSLAWWADDWDNFVSMVNQLMERGDALAFATVLVDSGVPVGSTSYLDIRPEHRSLEIGATWICDQYQGTFVNPEAKYLMLKHAFEDLGCIRVQFKTDSRNLQSQRAMEKLGCVKEGVLRNHMVLRDGFLRDSVFYSILDSEWPTIKADLGARLQSIAV